jgi:sigma-B regulation protein RsbU (phosphoserine phosphatase)
MSLQMHTDRVSGGKIALSACLSGGFAVGYAGLAMARRFKYMPLLAAVQFLVVWPLTKTAHAGASLMGQPEALQRQLTLLAGAAMIGIIAAYSLQINFFKFEGQRYFRVHTEMVLASEIHRSLVPERSETLAGFEIFGASVPSGEVGGDLVDVVERPGGWVGYVADVSGHGVQSGVLMAMFKTALRAQIAEGNSVARMLSQVHRTLFPLKMGNMFVTVGIVQSGDRGRLLFASAGHPPLLHYHKATGTVSELAALDPPLGIMAQQEFSEAEIQCEAGDVLLILTDGLTEVFDGRGNELGLEPLKKSFVAHVDLPLEELFRRLRAVATEFGPQSDDLTLLLARYRG